jgi:hypothetical protein
MMKVDKALLDVWKWKEEVQEDLSALDGVKLLQAIAIKAKRINAENKLCLPAFRDPLKATK